MKEKLLALLRFVQDRADRAVEGKVYVDTGPVLEREFAVRAGLGWFGKHTNLISKRVGSWLLIGEILLDIELDPDGPAADHCGTCTLCLEACPTDAIVEPYLLDSRLCISYLTIELKEDIPQDLREPMGNLVFGCDICQDVCPWNHPVPDSPVPELEPRPVNRSPELWELAQLSPDEFRERFSASPVKRAKWRGFVRNVAVAMGNSGNPGLAPELTHLLNSEDPMVRRHAGWALKRLGTRDALDAVRRRCLRESDPETRAALQRLLDGEAADPAEVS
jgi:epoxyqueuosine reductase